MCYMNCSKLTIIFLCSIILIACAGSEVKKEAKTEFESGLSFFERGQYEEAAPHFQKATELVPDFWEAHLYLARTYLNVGKWREALPPLRTAFRLSPDESHREIGKIVMDIFFKNTSKIDQETQSQFIELLKLK